MEKVCANCEFAKLTSESDDGTEYYQCRRFPPTPVLVPTQDQFTQRSGFSVQVMMTPVTGDHWCGEFTPDQSQNQ